MTAEIRSESSFKSLSFEEATQIVSEMTDRSVFEAQGSDAYSGHHPEYGQITLFMPSIGESILVAPADFHR